MRLVVKQNDRTINEFRFTKGPIYIGRHTNSQIFLPGRAVSRQHAVIFKTYEGKWMLEDLDSANKTYLNNEEIHKTEIKTGDRMRITDYTIEIDLSEDKEEEKPIYLEDTLVTATRIPQIITRKIDTEHAPDIKMPARRLKDFVQATEQICKADSPEEMLRAILSTLARQFSVFHIWCALRGTPSGEMTCQAGRQRDGKSVEFSQIKLNDKITEAIEKGQFLLMPQLPSHREQKIQSAMIAPIMGTAGCFGAIYIDNATDHEHYTLSDLDYLMLLSIHTATVLKNF